MDISKQIAHNLTQAFHGKNWPGNSVKDTLADVSWTEATHEIEGVNTIVALTYHIYYYVKVALPVLKGHPLDAHDKFSFDHPSIENEEAWQAFLKGIFADVDELAVLLSELSTEQWSSPFWNEKYGSYYRSMVGTIEHTYYHLGQIMLLKRLIRLQKI